jgi:hypothetical protein
MACIVSTRQAVRVAPAVDTRSARAAPVVSAHLPSKKAFAGKAVDFARGCRTAMAHSAVSTGRTRVVTSASKYHVIGVACIRRRCASCTYVTLPVSARVTLM